LFDLAWVKKQWGIVDALWRKHYLQDMGLIVGHANNGDSCRRQLMLQDYKSDVDPWLSIG